MAEGVNKLQYNYTMEHYSAIKKKNAHASYHMDESQT